MPGFTRQIILQTLTELMNEKPLSKITVKDIVERCGVNRNTFYYHFRDIPDAVEAVVKEELKDILKNQKSEKQKSNASSLPFHTERCFCRLSGSCVGECCGRAGQQSCRRV